MQKKSALYILFILITGSLFNCSDLVIPATPPGIVPGQPTGSLTLSLVVPDFVNHLFPQLPQTKNTSSQSRIVDHLTYRISISVSGADMTTINMSFSLDDMESNMNFNTMKVLQCTIPDVPCGLERLVDITTYDQLNNPLTTGSAIMETISPNVSNSVIISLFPVTYTTMQEVETINGSVDYEHTDYYYLDLQTPGFYEIMLSSPAHDTDLYIYSSYNSIVYETTTHSGIPTDESFYLSNSWSIPYWIGIFGNSNTGANSYALSSAAVTTTPVTVGNTVNGTVEPGKRVFYTLELSTTGLYAITLSSATHNVDLAVYNSYLSELYFGSSTENPTLEYYLLDFDSFSPETYTLAVFGSDAAGLNEFSLTIEEIIVNAFSPAFQAADLAPGGFASIAATGNEVFTDYVDDYSSMVPIGFDFTFHSDLYNTIYICSNGFISFQPGACEFNPFHFGSSDTPNDIIALALTDLSLDYAAGQRIYYELQGTAPERRLVIEYNRVQTHSSATYYVTGQIVLAEGNNSIELLYDRANCNLGGIDIAAGAENLNGSDTRGPGVITDVPVNDVRIAEL